MFYRLGWKYFILFRLNLTYFYTDHVCLCVCSKWRVVTGTDYVLVILFIKVGAHSVVESMIYINQIIVQLLQ